MSKSVFSPVWPLCKEGCFLNKNVGQAVFKTKVSFRISNFWRSIIFTKFRQFHIKTDFSRYFSLLFWAHEGSWNIIDFDLHILLEGFEQNRKWKRRNISYEYSRNKRKWTNLTFFRSETLDYSEYQNALFSRYFSLVFCAYEGCWNIIDFDLHVFLKGSDQMDNLTNSQH